MKPFRQLLRHPIKFVAGVVIVAIAIIVPAVSLCQLISAHNMQARLNDLYISTALFTDVCQSGFPIIERKLPSEADEWVKETVMQNQETIKLVSTPALASAYISGLEPDIYCPHDFTTKKDASLHGCNGRNECEPICISHGI